MAEEIREEQSVPVIEEKLVTGTRPVKTGSVRVRKQVERIRKAVDLPVLRDVIEVSRVPVNRAVRAMPEVREEGGVLIVPVVEEEIIVRRRLVLKEEIRIVRSRVKERAQREVTVGREHATVERLDAEGNVIASSAPRRVKEEPPSRFGRHKSILK